MATLEDIHVAIIEVKTELHGLRQKLYGESASDTGDIPDICTHLKKLNGVVDKSKSDISDIKGRPAFTVTWPKLLLALAAVGGGSSALNEVLRQLFG